MVEAEVVHLRLALMRQARLLAWAVTAPLIALLDRQSHMQAAAVVQVTAMPAVQVAQAAVVMVVKAVTVKTVQTEQLTLAVAAVRVIMVETVALAL